MFDTNYYLNKLGGEPLINKFNKYITRQIIFYFFSMILMCISLLIMLYGLYGYFIKSKNWGVYYTFGILTEIIFFFFILILDKFDPLSKNSKNDRIFILLYYLNMQIDKFNNANFLSKKFMVLKSRHCKNKITREFYRILANMQSSFIFDYDNKNINLLKDIIDIISDKSISFSNNNETCRLSNFISLLIKIYDSTNYFEATDKQCLNDDEIKSFIDKNDKLFKELIDMINVLKHHKHIIINTKHTPIKSYWDVILKFLKNKVFLTCTVSIFLLFLYFAGTVSSISNTVNLLIGIAGLAITIIVPIWKRK